MFDCWKVNQCSTETAKVKAAILKETYLNDGFDNNCNVVKHNESYVDGFTGEEEFCLLMDRQGVSYVFLNKKLNPNAVPDRGDFIINNQLVNLKTQLYDNGSPNGEWFANVNLKDFNDDKKIGIEAYHFILYRPQKAEMLYGGYCLAHDVPRLGRLVQKGEPVTPWFTASETMYVIRLNKLRQLVPDTYKNEYPF